MRAILGVTAALAVSMVLAGSGPSEAAGRGVAGVGLGSARGIAGRGRIGFRDGRSGSPGRYGSGRRYGFGYGGFGYGAYPGLGGGDTGYPAPVLPLPGPPVVLGIREAPSLPPAIYVIGAPSDTARRSGSAKAASRGAKVIAVR